MAVQIGVSGYQLRPPVQFMQPPPPFPPQSIAPVASFSTSMSMPVSAEPAVVQQKPLTAASPLKTTVNVSSAGTSTGGINGLLGSFDGRRMRSKSTQRRTVDYNASLVNYIQMVPPAMLLSEPVNAITTRSVRTATNKIKCPVFCTCWTPEGRRLVTGASSGEFTLWNGLTFSFETILQAHDTAVRSMIWSHNDQWMLTGDHGGFVKYWQSNMNNVKMYQAHKDPVRGLSFCPTDQKFASCSDDGTVRIWDFYRCYEEKILRGHGADVKCVDWHPHKSLLASGSKDTQQPVKLWDPRTGSHLATIHAHKHTVMDLKWNKNGNWLLTASRDHLLKLFDIRNMKEEVQSFRGHKKEATTIAWHPIHECLFTSGGSDGAIMFWLTSNDKEIGSIEEAHETMVWSLSWHPLGHVLVSGSNDHTTKFWTRNRLGDSMRDRYNLNTLPFGTTEDMCDDLENPLMISVPGLGLENGLGDIAKTQVTDGISSSTTETENQAPAIPGLDFSIPKTVSSQDKASSNLSAEAKAAAAAAARRKAIYTKPVPKAFERAWTEGRQPAGIVATGPPEPHPDVDTIPGFGFREMPGDPRMLGQPQHNQQQQSMAPNRWLGPQSGRPPMGFGGPRGDHPRQMRPSLRQPGPRPLLSLGQDGWQHPHGGEEFENYNDEDCHEPFDEYGKPANFGEERLHGDVEFFQDQNMRPGMKKGPRPGLDRGPRPGPGGPDVDFFPDQNMRPGPNMGPGPRHKPDMGPRPGLDIGPGVRHGPPQGPRGPRGPLFRPGMPHPGSDGNSGGSQFNRWQTPMNQEGVPHSDFQQRGGPQPVRHMGSSAHNSAPTTKPPSLLDIQVKPTLPVGSGGMKRPWDAESGGMHQEAFLKEQRMCNEGPPDGDAGQYGPMTHEMDRNNRGPMDAELMESGHHHGQGRGGFGRGGFGGPQQFPGNASGPRGFSMRGGRGR